MYDELIKSVNPLPRFNLKWYKNEDLYSEGDVEDVIIRLIAENKPEDYTGAISRNYCLHITTLQISGRIY
jgi:hypothetical protein